MHLENLTYLNEVIAAYNSEFENKENDKTEILYTDAKLKKGLAIKNAIVKSIEKIDESGFPRSVGSFCQFFVIIVL